MGYRHDTAKKYESELFPGVVYWLNKMTEGRRLDLRTRTADLNRRVREIMREQSTIASVPEETRDHAKWLDLQDEFDEIIISKINPEYIKWGVRKVEGLEADGKPLGVEEWPEWPSALFEEILSSVKAEAELNGLERKNLESPTISGELAGTSPSHSTADTAGGKGSGETEIASSTTQAG